MNQRIENGHMRNLLKRQDFLQSEGPMQSNWNYAMTDVRDTEVDLND